MEFCKNVSEGVFNNFLGVLMHDHISFAYKLITKKQQLV